MKNSILSAALLLGFGLSTGMAFFGGGNIHYVPETENAKTQQSDTSDTETNGTSHDDMLRHAVDLNHRPKQCANADGSACTNNNARLAQ